MVPGLSPGWVTTDLKKDNVKIMSERYYKVEGNIIYPDKQMLTWGPFYYHSRNNGVEKMESILDNITAWCNTKDTSLNIKPENIRKTNDNSQ